MAGLVLSLSLAWAHSTNFGMVGLSARAEAPDELWGRTDGWGVVHSTDGGHTWSWQCEESTGGTTVYDVLAWADGVAWVGTADGLWRVGADCGNSRFDGLPEGFVLLLERVGARATVAVIGEEEGGLLWCDDAGCTPTSLWGARLYPKSLVVDGDTVWATVVHTDTLAAELVRSDDGGDFATVYAWPDGDVDPRVMHAAGDTVLVWARPRQDTGQPGLLRSVDAGRTFTQTFADGFYTDPAPGVSVRGDDVLLGAWYGARTWRSTDLGATFSEVTTTAPAVRCSLALGEVDLVCGDHVVDGFDVARTDDRSTFVPLACLESALPAACAATVCEPYVDAWVTAGAYGGGACDAADDTAEPSPTPACGGCASAGSAAGAVGIAGALVALGRRRQWPPST